MKKIAAIDIGSNSLKMSIATFSDDRQVIKTDSYYKTTRLALAIDSNNLLNRQTIIDISHDIINFINKAKSENVDRIIIVATAAMRQVINRQEVLNFVYDQTDISIEVISGEQEALITSRAIARNAAPALPSKSNMMIFNIGGGSTELSIFDSKLEVIDINSFTWGVSTLTKHFFAETAAQPVSTDKINLMTEFISQKIRATNKIDIKETIPHTSIIGSGGTLNVIRHLFHFSDTSLHPPQIQAEYVIRLLFDLAALDSTQRAEKFSIPLDRADIIIAGLNIVYSFANIFSKDTIYYSSLGLCDGLLFDAQQTLWSSK